MEENILVRVGADLSGLTRDMNRATSEMRGFARETAAVGNSLNDFGNTAENAFSSVDTARINQEFRALSQEINAIENSFKVAEMRAVLPFRRQLMETERNMYGLANSMGTYTGSTKDFMNEVNKLGADYKKASDEMINANRMIGMSMIQTAGQMANMSTQASKISANYSRMANPMYQVNQAGLAVADSLNRIANNGNAATLSLRMLGPNASMKQLYDMQNMINQGLTRYPIVALAALATGVFVYGSLHKAAMESNKGYAESLNTMVANIKKAFQPMVDVFAMVITKVYDFVNTIAEMVIKFNEAHPVIAKFIQGFLMLIPAITLILAPLALGIGLWNGMLAVWGLAWQTIGPLITGLAAMSGTVLLVSAAIVALVGGITYLWNTSEGFRNAVITAWNAIKEAALAVWGFISPYIQAAIQAVSTFVQTKLAEIKAFWDEHGTQVMTAVQNAWNMITTIFQTAATVLAPIITAAWEIIKTSTQGTWDVIVTIISTVWSLITSIIDAAIGVIEGIIKVFTGVFTGDIQMAMDGVLQIITSVWELIKNVFTTVWNAIVEIVKTYTDGLKKNVETVMNAVKGVFTNILESIKSAVKGAFDSIKSSVTSAMDSIKSGISNAWNAIKSAVSSALNAISSTVSSIFNSLKSTVTTAMNNVKTAIINGWNAAKSFLSSIDLTSIGKDIIQGLINGISAKAKALFNKAQEIADGIKSKIQKALDTHSPSRWMRDEIGKNIVAGIIVGIDAMRSQAFKTAGQMADWFTPEIPEVSMAYTTPTGALSSLTSAVNGSVDVNTREDMLAKLVEELSANRTIVMKMDGYEVAKVQQPYLDIMNADNTKISMYMKGVSR